MGTKELGWSAARWSAVRFLALTLSVSAVALVLPARAAHADAKRSRDKIVELNKQALLSYEAKDFETARDLLTKALREAKQAGLDDDKMTARTFVHMGAVYAVGFADKATAKQNFALAKKIRPDIQLTPSIETTELKNLFELATAEPDTVAVPVPTPAKPASGTRTKAQSQTRAAPATVAAVPLTGDDDAEPDLPASMSAPLMCGVPDVAPPGKELFIRCALKPGLNAKVVQLHHRAPGVEAYQVLAMRKSAKGWYLATLPGHLMKAGTLQVFFDARDASDNEVASNGQADSPSAIEIRKKGSGHGRGGDDEDDPMKKIRDEQKDANYEAGLHRRREGAFWFSAGAGAGWGFAPAGNLEWERQIRVSAITTTTGMFHVLPEVGYMYSDTFGLALQARVEFIQQQQASYVDRGTTVQVTAGWISGAPTTMAFAMFARAINYIDLSSSGNFQFSFSGDVGGGFIRFPVMPVAKLGPQDANGNLTIDQPNTIAKTDTRAVGPFLLGASAGFIYHLSRHLAIALDARAVTGLPNFGAVLEGGLSLQLAFGGAAGPAPVNEDGEGEGESGVVKDAPPSADSSSSEEEE